MKHKIRYFRQDGTEYSFSKEPKIKIMQTSNADMNIGLPMKETAVEWLVIKWATQGTLFSSDILQAKQMEKEQIKEAYKIVDLDIQHEDVGEINSEQYYKENYE